MIRRHRDRTVIRRTKTPSRCRRSTRGYQNLGIGDRSDFCRVGEQIGLRVMLCKASRAQHQVQCYARGKSQYRLHLEISFIDTSSHNPIKKSHEEDKKAQTAGWGQMCGYSAWRFKPCSIRCRRSSGAKLGECERRVVLVPQCPGNLRVVSGLGKWHASAIAPSQTDVASATAE